MTHAELKQKFEVTGKTARDFIHWAEAKDVTVCFSCLILPASSTPEAGFLLMVKII